MGRPSVEDRLAIEELFVRYTCALDEGDVETLVGCFAKDATLESPAVGNLSGEQAIRAFAQRFARYRANGSQLRHVLSNLRIDVDGDRAHVRCYLTVFLTRDGASRLVAPGWYDCDLARHDGDWIFRRRVVNHDHDYTLEGL